VQWSRGLRHDCVAFAHPNSGVAGANATRGVVRGTSAVRAVAAQFRDRSGDRGPVHAEHIRTECMHEGSNWLVS
jgi:hypothetical protein